MRLARLLIVVAILAVPVWAGLNNESVLPYASGLVLGLLLLAGTRELMKIGRTPKVPKAVPTHELVALWDERVGAERSILPGSHLADVKDIRHGTEATIKLPPGALTTEDAVKVLHRVASAFELPVSALAIEPGTKASEARLLVIDDNPLDTPVPFPGPSLREDGSFDLGMYVDGKTATARFWRPNYGAVHMLLAGTTGAGKSSMFNIVLANAAYSGGLVVPWVIDPQGGQSMPEWIDHVDWAATSTREGIVMLEAALQVMSHRNRYLAQVQWTDEWGNARKGKASFEPTVDMPLLSIVIDEAAQLLLDQRAVELVSAIAKQARKCGIQLLLATQVPSVDELGGDGTIRDQLAGGMAVILRTGGPTSSRMIYSGMPMEPHRIPREMPDGTTSAGLGFTVGAATRAAVMRGYFVGDRQAWELARDAAPVALDPASGAAAGPAYAARHSAECADSAPLPELPEDPVEAAAGTAVTAVVDALVAAGGTSTPRDLIERTGYSRRSVAAALSTLLEDGTVTKEARGEYALKGVA